MQEAGNWNTQFAQVTIGGGAQKAAAKSIDQNANSDPSAMGPDQCTNELQTEFIGAEDIGGEPNPEFGALDGGEHLRISLISAIENPAYLADFDVLAGDVPDGDLQALNRISRRNVARYKRANITNGSDQSTRRAFHAIDAKADIQERSRNWSQPRHPDPSDCCRTVAFTDQRVNCNRPGYDEMEDAYNERTTFKQSNVMKVQQG
jgi:hypothetical protein